MDEMLEQAAAGPAADAGTDTAAETVTDAAPAEGQAPRKKKKKKRPADGTAANGQRSADTADNAAASGEMPRKKKRPADGTAANGQRSADTADSAAASGEMPRKKKKKRPADGTAVHRQRSADTADKPAASGEVPRRKKKRPAAKPAENEYRSADTEKKQIRRTASRPEATDRRPAQRTANRSAAVRTNTRPKRRPAAAAEKSAGIRWFSTGMFLIFLVLYIVIFSLVIHSKTKKANSYLTEFENSRPKYTIESYMETLNDGFLSDMMTQAAAGLNFTDYEKPEMLYESVRSQALTAGEYTYQRAEDFTDVRPDYYILRDGEAVAKVALARSGWTEKFNFPVWRVDTPVSVIRLEATPDYTLTVTMPEDATLKVNGVEVPEEQYLEAESDFQLSPTELYFTAQPMARKCVINGLYCVPEVTVTDSEGNVLEPYETPKPDHADQTYIFPIADVKEPDQGLTDRVTALTYAYMDYVINTRCEVDANLAVLSNYMLAGSPFANLMYTIASDVWYNNDPNMREDHTFEITHVKQYADNVCTVDVHLETTLGKVAVNDYCGTVRWVMVNTGYGWYASNMSLHP